jgi:hypothetical protein
MSRKSIFLEFNVVGEFKGFLEWYRLIKVSLFGGWWHCTRKPRCLKVLKLLLHFKGRGVNPSHSNK